MAARIRKYVEICRNCLPGDIKCTLSIQLGLGHSFFFFTLGLVTEVRRLIICKTVSRQLNLSGQHAYLNISRKFNALIVQYTLQTCNICVTIPCCLWIHDTTRSRSPYNTPHSPSNKSFVLSMDTSAVHRVSWQCIVHNQQNCICFHPRINKLIELGHVIN